MIRHQAVKKKKKTRKNIDGCIHFEYQCLSFFIMIAMCMNSTLHPERLCMDSTTSVFIFFNQCLKPLENYEQIKIFISLRCIVVKVDISNVSPQPPHLPWIPSVTPYFFVPPLICLFHTEYIMDPFMTLPSVITLQLTRFVLSLSGLGQNNVYQISIFLISALFIVINQRHSYVDPTLPFCPKLHCIRLPMSHSS